MAKPTYTQLFEMCTEHYQTHEELAALHGFKPSEVRAACEEHKQHFIMTDDKLSVRRHANARRPVAKGDK